MTTTSIWILAGIVLLLGLLWLASPKELKAILKAIWGFVVIVGKGLLDVALLIRNWSYTIRWRVRTRLRTWWGQTVSIVVTAGSFILLFETVVAWTAFAGHEAVLKRLPHIPAMPLWLHIGSIALAALVFLHHAGEIRLRNREFGIPAALRKMVDDTRSYLKKPSLTPGEKKTLFGIVTKEADALLRVGRKKHQFVFSMVQKNDATNMLATVFVYPPKTDKIDPKQELSLADENSQEATSAAGVCFNRAKDPANATGIYVPSIDHLGGIDTRTLDPVGLVYQKIATKPGKSLLCAPVFVGAEVKAVLNVASPKRDGFTPLDFHILDVVASLMQDAVVAAIADAMEA